MTISEVFLLACGALKASHVFYLLIRKFVDLSFQLGFNFVFVKETIEMKLFKITVVAVALITASSVCKAQTEMKPEEAAKHIGDSVRVCDLILEGKYLNEAKDAPTQLYMGSKQPDPMLTIVIPKQVKDRFKYDPEKKLVNKHVCVTGRVSTFEGHPAIYVYSENNIKDLDDK